MKALNIVARVTGKAVVSTTKYFIGENKSGGLLREVALSYQAGKAGATAPKKDEATKAKFTEAEIQAYAKSQGWDI